MKLIQLMAVAGLALVSGLAWSAGDCCKAADGGTAMAAGCCQGQPEKPAKRTGCCEGFAASDGAAAQADSGDTDATGPGRRGRMGGHGRGMGGGHREVMQGARTLIFNHGSITRTVEEIPNGVRTTTTTTDPDLVATLQSHPREMDELYSKGGSVRHWDPLFVELSKYHDHISMEFTDIEDGIEVTSTSENPEVVKLIRAHAEKVSEFVSRGHAAMREATPLPDGYSPPE